MCYTKRVKLDCVPGSCDLTEMTLCSCMGYNTTGWLAVTHVVPDWFAL